mgnify:CR=1 FL=1
MKKKIFALLTALCMTASVMPAVFADGEEEPIECTCATQCTAESKNETCPVCGGEDADLSQCIGLPPMTAGDGEDEEETIQCSCTTLCTAESKNETLSCVRRHGHRPQPVHWSAANDSRHTGAVLLCYPLYRW